MISRTVFAVFVISVQLVVTSAWHWSTIFSSRNAKSLNSRCSTEKEFFDQAWCSTSNGQVEPARLADDQMATIHRSYSSSQSSHAGTTVSRLLQNLMKNYDRRIRPNYNGQAVEVAVSIFVSGVSQVSEANLEVTLDFYFRQYWQDLRLSFDDLWDKEVVVGGDFGADIWKPDTFFVNSKHSAFHAVTTSNTFLRISPRGNVTQSVRLTVTASCLMDLTYFPMDSQKCSLEIESYGYTTRDIAYRWARSSESWAHGARAYLWRRSVAFAPQVSLPHFRVRGHRELTRHIELSSGNYSRLAVEIYLERNIGYYLIQVYIPSALIVMLSLVSFWIKRSSAPARVSLGITTVLTMTTLISSTNASLPKISYLKAIDVYLISCFVMVFTALLEYAAVAYTEKRTKIYQVASTNQCEQVSQLTEINNKVSKLVSHETPASNPAVGQSQQLIPFPREEPLRCKLSRLYHGRRSSVGSGTCDLEHCLGDAFGFLRAKPNPINHEPKASDIEKYSRIVFPTVFAIFNLFYWITYLNISIVSDEDGFVAIESA